MKTLYTLLIASFSFLTFSAAAQNQKTVFESASLTKSGDGAACVQLSWKKGSENTAYYLVERSANGVDFKQVGLVFTAENAAVTNYKFRDKSFAAAGATAHYRISMVNEQKELTYLPVQKVELSSYAFSAGKDGIAASNEK